MAMLTEEEEAMVNALLAPLQPQQSVAEPPAPTSPPEFVRKSHLRSQLVLDAACGGPGSWTTEVCRRDIDYVETREDGCAASVSVVLSLYRTEGHLRTATRESDALRLLHPKLMGPARATDMHDETGTGRVEKVSQEEAAIEQAAKYAVESARHRLAKRFAAALGQELLGAIEKQVNPHKRVYRR